MLELPLSDKALAEIEMNFCRGMAGEYEMGRLIQACKVQRDVLKTLFALWRHEPEQLAYFADPIRRHTLDALKERVAMEDA